MPKKIKVCSCTCRKSVGNDFFYRRVLSTKWSRSDIIDAAELIFHAFKVKTGPRKYSHTINMAYRVHCC